MPSVKLIKNRSEFAKAQIFKDGTHFDSPLGAISKETGKELFDQLQAGKTEGTIAISGEAVRWFYGSP